MQDSRTTSRHVNINMFDLLHPPFCIALGIRERARGSKVWQDLKIKEDFFTPYVQIFTTGAQTSAIPLRLLP